MSVAPGLPRYTASRTAVPETCIVGLPERETTQPQTPSDPMDIEFHYHMTYLITAIAGFRPDEATIIASSCQYTDDNIHTLVIDEKNSELRYENYYSQTYDITKAKDELLRVYCLFHFMPGDPQSPSAYRTDGLMHWLNTTPGSQNAEDMLDMALATGNLYRIGIACHTFADTYAHQNFIGYKNTFNSLKDPFSLLKPNIGHAEALHAPDLPGNVWEDRRLLSPIVVNKTRFLDAARALFLRLAAHRSPQTPPQALADAAEALCLDLGVAIGGRDPGNKNAASRMGRYMALAHKERYGDKPLPDYDPKAWFNEAVRSDTRGLPDNCFTWTPTLFSDAYHCKNPQDYHQSHWYLFQEAIKEHQHDMSAMLRGRNLKGLSLPGW